MNEGPKPVAGDVKQVLQEDASYHSARELELRDVIRRQASEIVSLVARKEAAQAEAARLRARVVELEARIERNIERGAL